MISSSAFAQASNVPLTVMVRSGLYNVRSCRLGMGECGKSDLKKKAL